MARLARIAGFPIKSLDPVERGRVRIVANGGLEHDREYAIVNENDRYVNGKRTADVHRVRASFDDEFTAVTLRRQDEADSRAQQFGLENDRRAIDEWLSDHFEMPVHLKRDTAGGFPDDTTLSGPTLISTGTLHEVASWFPCLDTHQLRLRLRANLEIEGVPPFWEDRLFADHDHYVAFRIGEVTFRGVNPCQRCVVPTRDPFTGEVYEDFQRIFIENRAMTLPEWADPARFNHYFRLMVNTQVPESEWGSTLTVGDEIEVLGERLLESTTE